MTPHDVEAAAMKIVWVLKPCLKKARIKTGEALQFVTKRGNKTEIGLVALVEDIIKNPYAED